MTREFSFVKKHDREISSATELMQVSGLDWTVSLNDVYASGKYDTLPIANKFATVKTTSNGIESVLGVTGSRYKVFQNNEIFSTLDPLVEDGSVKYGSAGELGHGKVVWAVLQLSSGITIGNDPHAAYILTRTSHDGSTPFQLAPMINRIACTNQINANFLNAKKNNTYYSVRHSLNSNIDIDAIRIVFNVIREDINKYADISNWLLGQSFTDSMFNDYVRMIYPMPSKYQNTPISMLSGHELRAIDRIESLRSNARYIWNNGNGTIDGIAGTKFAAFQSIIENDDHGIVVNRSIEKREQRILTGKDIGIKNHAYQVLAKF